MGYFEARRERRKRNHDDLHALAKAVVSVDSEMEIYVHRDDKLNETLTFIKDETCMTIGFGEVPFRWVGPEPTNGYLPNHKMPYVPIDIIDNMSPFKETTRYSDKKSYLKWYNYLTPITN